VADLLTVSELKLSIGRSGNRANPVDGVSFSIAPGECVGLVGESGCGKSLTALSLTGLSRSLPGARIRGSARWSPAGEPARELTTLPERQLRKIRGGGIGMVFQDPLSSLNPLLRVDYQVREAIDRHLRLSAADARERVVELLALTGMPEPARRARQYPHQLSGGIRQRVLLAIALAGEPQLLIADEPTTALDVTIQAQILAEIRRLQALRQLAVLFITHDLGVVAQLCQRVLVMYAGRIIEAAPTAEFFRQPRHPYSEGLLASLPQLDSIQEALACIPGSPPDPRAFPPGCRFAPRCPLATERCHSDYPPFCGTTDRGLACWERELPEVAAAIGDN
jgi:oligopeptide/dipeptide ABC transporter ATP-binding protein